MESRQRDLHDFVDSLEEEWLKEVPNLQTQGLAVVARLVRMGYYIARRVDTNLARFDLTRGEFEVLAVLTRNPEAKITPKDIHAKILITSGGLSNRIRKLEEKGLLVRSPDSSDGRGVVLKATEKGRELTLQAITSHVDVESQLVEGLTDAEREELAALLKKLILSQSRVLNPDSLR